MRVRIIIATAAASLVLMGCAIPPESKERVEKSYFDLSGLIEDQITLLSILNPTLNKKIEKDGKTEVLTVQLDSAQWSTELRSLAHLDINKPRLADSYTSVESKSQDDIKVVSYQLVDIQQSGTQYLSVYRDAILDNLLKIEASSREGNLLYQSASDFEMTFEMDDIGDIFLRSYRISGEQTMLFSETTRFEIEGAIEY